jgi:hypothetical protein
LVHVQLDARPTKPQALMPSAGPAADHPVVLTACFASPISMVEVADVGERHAGVCADYCASRGFCRRLEHVQVVRDGVEHRPGRIVRQLLARRRDLEALDADLRANAIQSSTARSGPAALVARGQFLSAAVRRLC